MKGRRYSVDIKQTITATDVHRNTQSITLTHTSELHADGAVVGTVAYAYKIELYKPYIGLFVTVRSNQGTTLSEVEVTTSLDQLDSLSNVRYSKFFGYSGAAPPVSAIATNLPERHVLWEGPIKWWSLLQSADLGFSYAISTLLGSPEHLLNIVSSEERNGKFSHVYARYGIGSVSYDRPVTVSERKILLAGGLYNNMSAYEGVFARLDSLPGLDLSMSYDIGAELNGVASAYLADKRRIAGDTGLAPVVYEPETRAWIDAILDAYLSYFAVKVGDGYPHIFSRGHSFVMLAVATMHEATADSRYLNLMRPLADALMQFQVQVQHGLYANSFHCLGENIFLDCHAAAMVAMARAAVATGDRRYAESARRGLHAYRISPEADTGNDVYLLQNGQSKSGDTYYWVFKAGLLLRSLEALEVLSEHGLVKLSNDEWHTIGELQRRALAYISRTVHARGSLDELLTCHKAAETNSESQAWALLGMYPIEHERAVGQTNETWRTACRHFQSKWQDMASATEKSPVSARAKIMKPSQAIWAANQALVVAE